MADKKEPLQEWYPSKNQVKDPESLERSFREVLRRQYQTANEVNGLKIVKEKPQKGMFAPGSGPTDSYVDGIPVVPIDLTNLADNTVLTYVKSETNLQFKLGGGTAGVVTLNGLAGNLVIAAGSGISVVSGGGTITISATGAGTGTVTNIATTAPITGGPITVTGTIGVSNATNISVGVVRPDNTTITVAGGVISAVGATVPNFADSETPSGTINSSNTVFTVAHTPSPALSMQLFLNGVLQTQTIDYTLAAATITYTSAPSTGDAHVTWYRY